MFRTIVLLKDAVICGGISDLRWVSTAIGGYCDSRVDPKFLEFDINCPLHVRKSNPILVSFCHVSRCPYNSLDDIVLQVFSTPENDVDIGAQKEIHPTIEPCAIVL